MLMNSPIVVPIIAENITMGTIISGGQSVFKQKVCFVRYIENSKGKAMTKDKIYPNWLNKSFGISSKIIKLNNGLNKPPHSRPSIPPTIMYFILLLIIFSSSDKMIISLGLNTCIIN